jgi:C-terminal processing protease CtpA/Prc
MAAPRRDPAEEHDNKRVEVSYVDPKGLAQQMGLKKGDALLEIDGSSINGNDDAVRAFNRISGRYTILIERETVSPRGERLLRRMELTGEIKRTGSGIYYHVRVP